MTPLGYASGRLKVLECKRKALLEEQAKKEEQFRCLKVERKVIIKIDIKSHQEAQDLIMALPLDDKFNNVHIGGGNNSHLFIPLETPWNGKHWRTPSPSPSPRGRRASRHDDYRRPMPLILSRQPSQHAHHGSQYGGSSLNFDHNSYDLIAMQQDPHFQQHMEAYMQQNKDACFQYLINKGDNFP